MDQRQTITGSYPVKGKARNGEMATVQPSKICTDFVTKLTKFLLERTSEGDNKTTKCPDGPSANKSRETPSKGRDWNRRNASTAVVNVILTRLFGRKNDPLPLRSRTQEGERIKSFPSVGRKLQAWWTCVRKNGKKQADLRSGRLSAGQILSFKNCQQQKWSNDTTTGRTPATDNSKRCGKK
jgi:hypothetical protein